MGRIPGTEVSNVSSVNYSYDPQPSFVAAPSNFENDLKNLINRYSKENDSNTPDYILASYLTGCLNVFNSTVSLRENYQIEKKSKNLNLGCQADPDVPIDELLTALDKSSEIQTSKVNGFYSKLSIPNHVNPSEPWPRKE